MPVPNKIRRITYQYRKANGLCPRCGAKKSRTHKFILCKKCLNFFREYQEEIAFDRAAEKKEQYKLLKKQRRCTRCKKPLPKNYKNSRCRPCLERQYNYEKKRK